MSRLKRSIFFLAFYALLAVLFLLISPPSAYAQPPFNGFQATYFRGTQLQGPPILTRIEPVINWTYDAGGSPATGIVPTTTFSTRWEGWYYIDRAGDWTFTYTADDGGRVWLDNELVMDMWYDHQPLTRTKTQGMGVGYHLIRVEYYQTTGDMTSQLTITPPELFPDWMGEYFDNPYVLGEPRYRLNNPAINFNWGSGSPDPRIPVENFSVRWTRLYNFAPGSYTFTATADDGIRVWVGDTLAIDGWLPQQARTYTKTLYLNGSYPLRVEYFEQSGQAVVDLTFQSVDAPPPPTAGDVWRGEFFPNSNLAPPAKCEQTAAGIQFNWEAASPGCDIGGQFFSARWNSSRVTPATGFYTLNLFVDDGARIYIDDNLILDAWREQPPTAYSTTVYLNAGEHAWRVEYFQSTGGAQITLTTTAGVTSPTLGGGSSDEIIVDALGTGWAQGGNAATWRVANKGFGGSALFTNNNSFIQPLYSWGRWYPRLSQARNYEIFVYIPQGVATTKNARYSICHDGRFDSLLLPQAAYADAWVSLGTYAFTGQGGEYVALSDVTYEPSFSTTVVWDAVKFVPR